MRSEKERWRKRSPEERRATIARSTMWKRNNPGRWAAICRRSNLKRKYGLTGEEMQQMFENQEGLCAICSQPMCLCTKRCLLKACVDHNHDTDEIRGLLHAMCNAFLGIVRDSPALLRNAIGYLGEAT